MGAFDFLSQQQGVQLPDPVASYGKTLTLASLARQNRLGEYQEKEQERARAAMVEANRGLAEAQQVGWQQAIANTAQRNPDAAALMLKYRKDDEGAQADIENKKSQTEERRFGMRQKAYGDVGNVAFAEAQKPGPMSVSKVMLAAKFYGIDKDLAPPPQDPAQLADWLSGIGNAAIAAKDQLSNTTQVRGQDMTQATAREGRDVTMRGQDLTDRRARDFNAAQMANAAATRETAAATRDAARTTANASSIAAIRKEFNGLQEVQNFKAAAPVIASARKAPDTPAGDLDLIYAVGKVLDPNSVVREGEMALVIKSGSPMEKFQGMANYVMGGGRLPAGQRAKLVKMLDGRVAELENSYKASRQTYERAADAAGLPKDQIFTDVDAGQAAAPTAPTTAGKVVDTMPMPKTLAEGTRVQDNKTGKILVVRGGKYVPE